MPKPGQVFRLGLPHRLGGQMDKPTLEKKIAELKVQHNQLFVQFHQIEGAIKALEFMLAQEDTPPSAAPES